MKNFFNFVKWWWKKKYKYEKISLLLVFYTSMCLLSGIFFGIYAILFYIASMIAVIVGHIVYSLIQGVKKEWQKYQDLKDQESQEIMYRLRHGVSSENQSGPG